MDITIDTAAVEQRLNDMLKKIEHVRRHDLRDTMSDWQVQDMHRNRPFTMRWLKLFKVQTRVRPHSLYETKRSAQYQRRQGGRIVRLAARGSRRAGQVFRQFEPKMSTRPYLRAELKVQLLGRMRDMMQEKLTWGQISPR